MADRLQDRVAVVTGGGAHTERVFGIGEHICQEFAEEGARVVVVDVDQAMADRTAEVINDDTTTPEAIGLQVDITDEDAVEGLSRECTERFGRVDALVNNAGVRIEGGPLTELSFDDWEWIFDVNLRGMAMCSKHLIPLMMDSGGGAIVNISSANAELGREGWSVYDATKAGVLALTRDMACDHADDGIRANCILPGGTVTDYHIENSEVEDVDAHIEDMTQPRPNGPGILKRNGHPREIAKAVLFLASEESSFITGTSLNVDGGLVAAGY